MSIRSFFALLLFFTLSIAAATVFYAGHFFEEQIFALLPTGLSASTVSSIDSLIFQEMLLTIALGSIISITWFWIVGNYIALPLFHIARAMNTFSFDGTPQELPSFSGTPKEVRTLAAMYATLTQKVELAHEKDTETSRVKSDFISTAAHQFRTPLTAIRWALEALEKENLTEDQRSLVVNAMDKSRDLVSIVKTLLDISSIESGKFKYVFEPADLSVIVEAVAKDLSMLAQKSQVTLYYAKSSEVLPLVNVDVERIEWILSNLVENAIRYTPAQGSVRLDCDSKFGKVYVRVSDTGIGIQDQDKANIFERFYRAGNAIAKENQGNGLGLYIARTIATDHGGDLMFEANTSGPGTTFVLSLPVLANDVA